MLTLGLLACFRVGRRRVASCRFARVLPSSGFLALLLWAMAALASVDLKGGFFDDGWGSCSPRRGASPASAAGYRHWRRSISVPGTCRGWCCP